MNTTVSLVEQTVTVPGSIRRWLFFTRTEVQVRTHLDFVIDGVPLREHVRR